MIKRLHIWNFKSLRDVTIDFDPLTVLIGRSGAGKTNIVESLEFWRHYLIAQNFNVQQQSWERVLSATDRGNSQFGIDIIFSVPGYTSDFRYKLEFALVKQILGGPSLIEELLEIDGKMLFRQANGKWLTEPPMAQPVPAGATSKLGDLYGLPEAGRAYLALTAGLACYDFPSQVLTGSGTANVRSQGLSRAGENYLEVFERITSNLGDPFAIREILAALQTLNSTVRTLELDTRSRNRILVGHAVEKKLAIYLELDQQSEGFRRFLAHMLALYQIPRPATVVFEEVEKGIYPRALATLADYFTQAVQSNRFQIILTTHSPQLLDHFPVEALRVVEMPEYETRVGPVSSEQLEAVRASLLTTGELLTADPARADMATAS